MIEVQIFPLVSKLILPVAAPAGTRPHVPPGYGVQEHCLPFTAATALGFLIKSPISFGLCAPGDVPSDGHAFRSPLARHRPTNGGADDPVFYVKDDPSCCFVKNAFTLDVLDDKKSGWLAPKEPGISFFDREDQLDLFKLHLPYIWRTPPEVDALFLPVINRSSPGLIMLCGLVETDWYASQVNLVFGQQMGGPSVHVAAGDPVGQVVFLPRSHRRPSMKVLPPHMRAARDLRAELAQWYAQHSSDRSAYKKLARSQHGRLHNEPHS
jgi:hypothetical protein